jgi:hypothetical protein
VFFDHAATRLFHEVPAIEIRAPNVVLRRFPIDRTAGSSAISIANSSQSSAAESIRGDPYQSAAAFAFFWVADKQPDYFATKITK